MPTFTSEGLHALSRAARAATGSERKAALRPRAGLGEVPTPGEPERCRRAECLAHRIEVDERTWQEIPGAARGLGLVHQQIDQLTA